MKLTPITRSLISKCFFFSTKITVASKLSPTKRGLFHETSQMRKLDHQRIFYTDAEQNGTNKLESKDLDDTNFSPTISSLILDFNNRFFAHFQGFKHLSFIFDK